ncbi:hypothetical protein GW17_00002586 [Ensete ventricosum]|nr:hypothetical protein GW17_00002586 [Ensete ventricosum]
METAPFFPVDPQIPVDFKIRKSLTGHGLTVHDAQGSLAYRICPPRRLRCSSSPVPNPRLTKTLFDAAGNPLISVVYHNVSSFAPRLNLLEGTFCIRQRAFTSATAAAPLKKGTIAAALTRLLRGKTTRRREDSIAMAGHMRKDFRVCFVDCCGMDGGVR